MKLILQFSLMVFVGLSTYGGLAIAESTDSQASTQVQHIEAVKDVPAALTETVSVSVDKPIQKLADVKKIFIAPLGPGEGAELIRQKIINRLIKGGSLTVTETAEDADATLVGAAVTSTGFYFNRYGGGSTHSASLAVRLIGKTKQVLWIDETRPKYFGSRSASSNVADRLVNDLRKAITKDQAQIATKVDKHS